MSQRFALVALGVLMLLLVGQQLQGCAASAEGPVAAEAPAPVVVLVSLDGFRHDYLDRADVEAPTLRRLAAEGVRAERLVPVYPTKTFPNHYSIVTGLHPERHGIVGNTMRDPLRLDADGAPARFSLSNRDAIRDGRWWGGEPIWVTAERQGVRTATAFWPGSEAEIGGVRPSHWLPYDGAMPYADRVDQALTWLDLPADERPGLVLLYFEAVDTAGHRHGPASPETAAAIAEVDAALARLVGGLRQRGVAADLVVVSDHGMAAVAPDRRVLLDDAVDLDAVADVVWGEAAGIWPGPGQSVDSVVARVDRLDHVAAYRRAETPERLRYRGSPRIPPVVVVPDVGWVVTSRAYAARRPDWPSGGAHGYDNVSPAMHGLFLAHGPSVRAGVRTGPVHAVDVYGILAEALGVTPAPTAGSPGAVTRVLR